MIGSGQEDTTALTEDRVSITRKSSELIEDGKKEFRRRRGWFPVLLAAIPAVSKLSGVSEKVDGVFGWGNFTPG
ncbi:hypothetical protein L1987_74274 [Smallanthus sonchifolius]|uniref:Uncharacterized protein n=1 Tax=Smallanthus sonchifolius TaxID=185202 RepID=A0ACB9A2K7_9ASTR|nr:hypothetical protein L1987_74274 [Smallanthus sonchifolius]